MKNNLLLRTGLALLVSAVGLNASAQLSPRAEMNKTGNYDVKMVSAPALQPAWISSSNPMTVVDIMTNEEMFGAGDDNALNNRFD